MISREFIKRSRGRLSRAALAAFAIYTSQSCRDVLSSTLEPPFIAIVARFDTPDPALAGSRYEYHVRELSGTVGVDTVLAGAPSDTLILAVPPATYAVTVSGVPPQCRVRGPDQVIVVPPETNTSIVRYFVTCRTQLTMVFATDGFEADPEFIYRVTAANGAEFKGVVGSSDSVRLDGLVSGPAMIDVVNVASNCMVVSDGGAHRVVPIDSANPKQVDFRVRCSNNGLRPQVVAFNSTYHDGSAAMVLRVTDPDGDPDSYSWDLTDCRRNSVIRGGPRLRRPLAPGMYSGHDTLTIIGGVDVSLLSETAPPQCAVLWVADQAGNLSAIQEIPLGRHGSAPVPTSLNARFNGVLSVGITLTVQDADADFLGLFVGFRMRDGTFRVSDGAPDILLLNARGTLGSYIPDVALGQPPVTYDNFLSAFVFVVDTEGNFTRFEDADLFN